ncbi:MAG: WD40 repeat domain-containing protein [Planctomycetota bacterium]|jgi:WD40 repeat protein
MDPAPGWPPAPDEEPAVDHRATALWVDAKEGFIFVGTRDGRVHSISPTGENVTTVRAGANPWSIAGSGDLTVDHVGTAAAVSGRRLVVGRDAHAYDIAMEGLRSSEAGAAGRSELRLLAHGGPGAPLLAADGAGRIHRIADGASTTSTVRLDGEPRALALRPGGRVAYAAGEGDLWWALDTETLLPVAEERKNLGYPPIHVLQPCHDGACLAVSHGSLARIKTFTLEEDGSLGELTGYFKTGAACLSLDWNPVEPLLLGLGHVDGMVRVVGQRTDGKRRLEAVREFDAHNGIVRAIRWSADGSILYSAGDDGTVAAWGNSGLIWRHELGK